MRTQLKSLQLVNFKGIKSLKIDFKDQTSIYGQNASGKTTIFDAFTWLLFGKDSTDRKDFEIKTLDTFNQVIPKLDHEVTGILQVDGRNVTLKRVYKEKWVKRRGTDTESMDGHETLFYVDDVPYQANEYQKYISSLIDESVFKMITNPHYFNSLHWTDRRKILSEIVGEISDNDIAATNPAFQELLAKLEGRTLEQYRKMIREKIKKLKDDLKNIPPRIDELSRNNPIEPDYDLIRKSISQKKERLAEIEKAITDKTKEYQDIISKKENVLSEVAKIKTQILQIKHKHETQINQEIFEAQQYPKRLTLDINNLKIQLSRLEQCIHENNLKVENLNKKNELLRAEWQGINESILTFNDAEFCCPTCKRAYEKGDIESKKESLIANFNQNKVEKLNEIHRQGTTNKGLIEQLGKEIESQNAEKAELALIIQEKQKEYDVLISTPFSGQSLGSVLANDQEYNSLLSKATELQESSNYEIKIDDADLRSEKSSIQEEIDQLNRKLNIRELVAQNKSRISELESESKFIAQQISDFEKDDFIIQKFDEARVEIIESRLADKFETVRFKMFQTNINGGVEPTCITLVNGVPYPDANNAAKINSGIEIINVLSDHFNVHAPIIIDNREAVNELHKTDSQIINLIVSLDETLKIA